MNRAIIAALLLAVSVAACDAQERATPGDNLDAIARDYVKLSLTIGEKEEGYIDAYYGPPELQAAAKADAPKLNLDQLAERAAALKARVAAFSEDKATRSIRAARASSSPS